MDQRVFPFSRDGDSIGFTADGVGIFDWDLRERAVDTEMRGERDGG